MERVEIERGEIMMGLRKLIAATCCAAKAAIPAATGDIIHDAEKCNIRLQITPVIKRPFMG